MATCFRTLAALLLAGMYASLPMPHAAHASPGAAGLLAFRLAVDHKLFSALLSAFLRTLFAWQRRRGRTLGIRDGQTGAVTLVQRFSGALNLHPHAHSLVPDGLFVPGAESRLTLVPLPEPTASLQQAQAPVVKAPVPPSQLSLPGQDPPPPGKPLCARVAGFSLHAAQAVSAGDREVLERLCRYGLRPPFAQDRLSMLPDGRVAYRLHRPWPPPLGTTRLLLDPLDFLKQLTALIPAPYTHMIRYHGILANRSRWRRLLPQPPAHPSAGDRRDVPRLGGAGHVGARSRPVDPADGGSSPEDIPSRPWRLPCRGGGGATSGETPGAQVEGRRAVGMRRSASCCRPCRPAHTGSRPRPRRWKSRSAPQGPTAEMLEPYDLDAVVLLPADFEHQIDQGIESALELEEMPLTRRPEEIFAAEDESDWEEWVEFFGPTREADCRRKGLVEIRL